MDIEKTMNPDRPAPSAQKPDRMAELKAATWNWKVGLSEFQAGCAKLGVAATSPEEAKAARDLIVVRHGLYDLKGKGFSTWTKPDFDRVLQVMFQDPTDPFADGEDACTPAPVVDVPVAQDVPVTIDVPAYSAVVHLKVTEVRVHVSRKVAQNWSSREYSAGLTVTVEATDDWRQVVGSAINECRDIVNRESEGGN